MTKHLLIPALAIQLLLGQFMLPAFAQEATTTKPSQKQKPVSTQIQQPDDEETVRITTNLVQVDAVVTNKNGKRVSDLRPDEVQIFEDGRQQQITHFSFVNAAPVATSLPVTPGPALDKNAPPLPAVKLQPKDVRRTIALLVDDLNLSFESTYGVRRALKKFVDQQMQPGDLVAIIRSSGGIGALQQFTADKRQLYAAIDRVKWYANGRAGTGAFPRIEGNGALDEIGAAVDDNQGNNQQLRPPTGGNSGNQEAQAASEAFVRFREDLFSAGTLGAVRYVVTGMRSLPGRKSVLLISDGLQLFDRSNVSLNYRILMALRSLVDEANRATVVIHTMNATGLQTLALTAEDSTGGISPAQLEEQINNRRTLAFDAQEGLDYLAKETGGLAIRNTNDLTTGIRRVVEDQNSYYLIGYRPDHSTFDVKTGRRTFHKLSLKVSRPGKFNVRMRNGFFGISDDEVASGPKTRLQQMIGALTSPFGSAGVQVRLTSLFANDAKLGSFMRSMLHIQGSDLTFTEEPDGWHRSVFDILAITFGDNGAVVDQISRTHTIRLLGKAYERVLREGFTYNITVPVKKPGAYQLRAALRDVASERVGSAGQFIEVPDIKKNRLLISGIVLSGVSPQNLRKNEGAPGSSGNSDDTVDDTDLHAGPALRLFKSELVMLYGYYIYNARIDKTTGKPQLQTQVRMFRNGQQVFTGRPQILDTTNQSDLKRLAANGAIQLGANLIPGEYAFQVIVTDLLARDKNQIATQWIDFEIVK